MSYTSEGRRNRFRFENLSFLFVVPPPQEIPGSVLDTIIFNILSLDGIAKMLIRFLMVLRVVVSSPGRNLIST